MKDYYHFEVNDFVRDDRFREWVWNPSDATNSFWRNWLNKHPDKLKAVEEARSVLSEMKLAEYTLQPEEVTALWQRIMDPPLTVRDQKQRTQRVRWRWPAAAAAAVIALLIIFSWPDENMVTVTTQFGETRTVTLPDQSKVILNGNTSIAYSEDWSNREVREIHLTGEAYFDVRHTESHQPFRVKVHDGVAVEVLGTTFNVYHRTEETKVVLTTGSIRLHVANSGRKSDVVTMQPGEMVEVKNRKVTKQYVDTNDYVAWTHHILTLDQTSLKELIRMLSENYGLKVIVDDPNLLEQTVSGSIPMPEKGEAVQQIARAFQLEVRHEEDTYRLSERIAK